MPDTSILWLDEIKGLIWNFYSEWQHVQLSTKIREKHFGDCKQPSKNNNPPPPPPLFHMNRLVGLVVKASASRAEDPRFDSRLRRGDISGSSQTSVCVVHWHCTAQLSMFNMEKRFRNKIIIIIIIIIIITKHLAL